MQAISAQALFRQLQVDLGHPGPPECRRWTGHHATREPVPTLPFLQGFDQLPQPDDFRVLLTRLLSLIRIPGEAFR